MPKFNLNDIQNPLFLKNLDITQLEELAADIRDFLITNIARTGGHLSSNLGVVELTIALYYVFNSPTDKIFFDVGHQCYTQKILTGRAKDFPTLRKYQGLSGFQKRNESIHDVWEAGHSSTALSAAVGMACARDLNHQQFHIVPVIGDAAIVGGESLEALNHLGATNKKVIIILNDNQMSISKNVGGFSEFLSDIRTSNMYNTARDEYREIMSHNQLSMTIYEQTKKFKNFIKRRMVDSKIFGEFGVDYLGPINGHDFNELIRTLEKAKTVERSVVVHTVTTKGMGYAPAQLDTDGRWHGVEPFDIATGKPLQKASGISWSEFIAYEIYHKMSEDQDIVTITPAMISGSKLDKIFNDFKERSFDVGIAEQHAATFAAGLAISGKKPFLTVYSSFLQRCYDQINHDICRMNLPVVLGIDRAGLATGDGETHHGIYDLGLLKPLPNTTIFVPACQEQAHWYLNDAFNHHHGLHIIRYGKGEAKSLPCKIENMQIGKWMTSYTVVNPKAIFVTYGPIVNEVCLAMMEKHLPVEVINACFLKPIDYEMTSAMAKRNLPIIVYETDLKSCGLAKDMKDYLFDQHLDIELYSYGLPDIYLAQGSMYELLHEQRLALEDILVDIERIIHEKRTD